MKRHFLSLLLILVVFLTGCNTEANEPNETAPAVSGVIFSDDFFTDRDRSATYDLENCVQIVLNGTSASSDSEIVFIDGSTVTISREGTYILSGDLTDGSVIVNCRKDEKVQLVLNGVTIHSSSTAPICVLQSDKVFLTLAEGTENILSNDGTFPADAELGIDAVVFSREDLTINGSGSLTVTSPGGHGIVSKDSMTITGGTYHISCAGQGLSANDSIGISDGTFFIDAGKDGIHAENNDDTSLGSIYIQNGTFEISAEGDGVSAGAACQIDNGIFDVLAGGGSVNGQQHSSEHWGGMDAPDGMGGGRPGRRNTDLLASADESTSMKGIKSGSQLLINGGVYSIDSADDALHSNDSLTICGGTFEIASGDDAIHGEDTLTVSTGTIRVFKSYEGLEALHIRISGGEIHIISSDDGLNAAGGSDQSGMGGRDQMFGGPGGMGGPMDRQSNGSIIISGGTIYVNASGDGLDANGTLEITGGFTTVVGPTTGDTATLDYDTSGVISGGTFIGTGASGMAQTFSDSRQGVIAVRVVNQRAGTQITLTDAKGNTVLAFTPELDYSTVILSSPDMEKGETYKIIVGSSSGEFEAY